MAYSYIGLRYVPKFDSVEWDNTNTYQPLVIVTYDSNKYISKTHVPTGIDILNTDYWALYSIDYESIIEGMQTDISNLQTALSTAQTNITNLQTDMSTAQTDITNLQTDMSTAQTDISNLEEISNYFIDAH